MYTKKLIDKIISVAVLFVFMFSLIPFEVAYAATSYGEWGPWQTEKIDSATGIQVETRVVDKSVDKTVYEYDCWKKNTGDHYHFCGDLGKEYYGGAWVYQTYTSDTKLPYQTSNPNTVGIHKYNCTCPYNSNTRFYTANSSYPYLYNERAVTKQETVKVTEYRKRTVLNTGDIPSVESPVTPVVTKPTSVKVTANKATYSDGETIFLNWSQSDGATRYQLDVRSQNPDKRLQLIELGNVRSYSLVLEPGEYKLGIYPWNDAGMNSSNVLYLSVKSKENDLKPASTYVTINKKEFINGEKINLNWEGVKNATNYQLDIRTQNPDKRLELRELGNVTSYSLTLSPGSYKLGVYPYNSVGMNSSNVLYVSVRNSQESGNSSSDNLSEKQPSNNNLLTQQPIDKQINYYTSQIDWFKISQQINSDLEDYGKKFSVVMLNEIGIDYFADYSVDTVAERVLKNDPAGQQLLKLAGSNGRKIIESKIPFFSQINQINVAWQLSKDEFFKLYKAANEWGKTKQEVTQSYLLRAESAMDNANGIYNAVIELGLNDARDNNPVPTTHIMNLQKMVDTGLLASKTALEQFRQHPILFLAHKEKKDIDKMISNLEYAIKTYPSLLDVYNSTRRINK